jgi:SAM-dependent methyltransferase
MRSQQSSEPADREAAAYRAAMVAPRFDVAFAAINRQIALRFGAAGLAWSCGRCNICGSSTAFVHMPERTLRESLICSVCYATSRYRALARGVLSAIGELVGADVATAADLPRGRTETIRVLDTQPAFFSPPHGGYTLPTLLAATGWITVETTRFKPLLPWGATIGPQETNQNLEALTYPDSHFDMVLTSDVMEHVRLYERAHREIRRILKPGGYYIFTVPSIRGQEPHVVRVQIHDPDDAATDEHVLPPEYHGSPETDEQATGGVLAYRAFGTALDAELSGLGFEVRYLDTPDPSIGLFGAECFVCRLAGTSRVR